MSQATSSIEDKPSIWLSPPNHHLLLLLRITPLPISTDSDTVADKMSPQLRNIPFPIMLTTTDCHQQQWKTSFYSLSISVTKHRNSESAARTALRNLPVVTGGPVVWGGVGGPSEFGGGVVEVVVEVVSVDGTSGVVTSVVASVVGETVEGGAVVGGGVDTVVVSSGVVVGAVGATVVVVTGSTGNKLSFVHCTCLWAARSKGLWQSAQTKHSKAKPFEEIQHVIQWVEGGI